jgi:hypothetical protein
VETLECTSGKEARGGGNGNSSGFIPILNYSLIDLQPPAGSLCDVVFATDRSVGWRLAEMLDEPKNGAQASRRAEGACDSVNLHEYRIVPMVVDSALSFAKLRATVELSCLFLFLS